MLYLHHNDKILFRMNKEQNYQPGTWDTIKVPNCVIDQFGFVVKGSGITFEGDICDPSLPGTFAGLPAFCMIHPKDY